MDQQEKYVVDGFTRESAHTNVPNEVLIVIGKFAHNEYNHLYQLGGDIDKYQLQKQILKDVINQAGLKFYETFGLQEIDVQIRETNSVNCGYYVIIYPVDCGISTNRIKSSKRDGMNYSTNIVLQCPAVRHDANDMFCLSHRFKQFITLKQQDNEMKSNKAPFFRKVKTRKGVSKYAIKAYKRQTFTQMFVSANREIHLNNQMYQ
eukprot:343322_1